jgi:hypothetical protein
MNKMLIVKAMSILSGARLTQEFWVEAVDTTRYLVNMSPPSVIVDTNPKEVWYGKKL